MTTSEDLDRSRVVAVTRDRSMVMPIGAGQIREHLGVTSVGLRSRDVVPISTTSDGEWVDRIELISRGDLRLHP
jgi:hypothetical protein